MKRVLSEIGVNLRIVFILSMVLPAISQARPPTPPISISATLEEIKGTLSDGALGYVVQLEQREESKNMRLEAFLTLVDSAKPLQKRNSIYRKEFQHGEKAETEIPIRIDGPGLYRLEVKIPGEIDGDNGFSSVLICI